MIEYYWIFFYVLFLIVTCLNNMYKKYPSMIAIIVDISLLTNLFYSENIA